MSRWLRVVAYFLLWGALIAACHLVPLGLALGVHPLAGCLAAVAGVALWLRYGPGGFVELEGWLSTLAFLTLLITAVGCLLFLVWDPRASRRPVRPQPAAAVPAMMAPARWPAEGGVTVDGGPRGRR